MDLKVCSRCKEEKDINNFAWYHKQKEKLQSYCKSCRKEIDANYWKNNKDRISKMKNKRYSDNRKSKQEVILKYKEVPCFDCGAQYPHYVMDFDHQCNKIFNISDSYHRNLDLLLEEIKKCQVVCANCHRIRTFNRKNLTTNVT